MTRWLAPEVDSPGGGAPQMLELSGHAEEMWASFTHSWAAEQALASGELAAALAKLEAYAARIALNHHFVTHVGQETDDRQPVEPRSVEAGIVPVQWFANEIQRIYRRLSETPTERDARELIQLVNKRAGTISIRELERARPLRYPSAQSAEEALTGLVAAGVAAWREEPATAPGRFIKLVAAMGTLVDPWTPTPGRCTPIDKTPHTNAVI